jgi:hypothetical protein
MELISEDARSLYRIIKMLKEALISPHMTGVTRQREDKRRQAAARHLAEIRDILAAVILMMEKEGIEAFTVDYAAPRIPSIKPRIRRRGKNAAIDDFDDD